MSDGDLVRLIYASTATFEPRYQRGIEVEVGRILTSSRKNNTRVAVGGVLHYGNGYFFQCLEGERDAVTAIYNRIGADSRHRDVRLLSLAGVPSRLFRDWSMKYLPVDGPINAFLERRKIAFDPYRFDDDLITALLNECAGVAQPARAAPEKRSWWRRLFGRR